MLLSSEDIKILELEKQIQHYEKFLAVPNIAEADCNKYHNKVMKALHEQLALLYDSKGEYRKDKKHLLVQNACYLNLKLLDEIKQ